MFLQYSRTYPSIQSYLCINTVVLIHQRVDVKNTKSSTKKCLRSTPKLDIRPFVVFALYE